MPSSRMPWQLLLVFTIWICAVLVRPFAGDDNVLLFTSKSAASIDGSHNSNSRFRPSIAPASSSRGVSGRSSREEVRNAVVDAIDAENQPGILLSSHKFYASPARGLLSGLPATLKWTQSSLLQVIPRTYLGSAKYLIRIIFRSVLSPQTNRRDPSSPWQQQQPQHIRKNVSAAYLVVSSKAQTPQMDQLPPRTPQHVADDSKFCDAPPPSDRVPPSPSFETDSIPNPPSQKPTPRFPFSLISLLDAAIFSNKQSYRNNLNSSMLDPSEAPATPSSSQPSGPSSGRTAAERSCLGLVIGLVVAIVWL